MEQERRVGNRAPAYPQRAYRKPSVEKSAQKGVGQGVGQRAAAEREPEQTVTDAQQHAQQRVQRHGRRGRAGAGGVAGGNDVALHGTGDACFEQGKRPLAQRGLERKRKAR